MVPKELTNEELLELEQEQKRKKEVREKETTGEEKKRGTPTPTKEIYSEGLAEGFTDLNKLF